MSNPCWGPRQLQSSYSVQHGEYRQLSELVSSVYFEFVALQGLALCSGIFYYTKATRNSHTYYKGNQLKANVHVLQSGPDDEGTLLVSFDTPTLWPDWKEQNVDIPAQADDFQIVIRGIGSFSFEGDAAIDDISMRSGKC